MKIGVISDTHDNLVSMKRALDIFLEHKVDLIIHCGDWIAPSAVEFCSQHSGDIPIQGVIGNNPGDIRALPTRNAKLAKPIQFAERHVLETELDGRHIAATHGDDKAVVEALIASRKYDAVFVGHTHEKRHEVINKTLVLNPGATCFGRGPEILSEASVAIYDTATNAAEFITYTAQSLYE